LTLALVFLVAIAGSFFAAITLDNDISIRFTWQSAITYSLPVLGPFEALPHHQKSQLSKSTPDNPSDDKSENDNCLAIFSSPLHSFMDSWHITSSFTSCPHTAISMASKIIPSFVGPITPSAIDKWLSQCKDGFAIYASTKSEKSPALNVVTQIHLTGTQLQEPTAAAWWNAGRKECLKLATWELFEKQIHTRFMAKGYRLLALLTFFLCMWGKLPFLEYAAALMKAQNLTGSTAITSTIYRYQLLFHSHNILLLHIMALPDFDINTITVDSLTFLMSMQRESCRKLKTGKDSCVLESQGFQHL
jgi:hypothetical protein